MRSISRCKRECQEMDGYQQQTSKWKGAGFKLEEYQAAKIYSNETTVDTDFR